MFTRIQLACARAWQTLVNPTVRLQANFPWTFGKMAKAYVVSALLFAMGSVLPLAVLKVGIRYLETNNWQLLQVLFGPHMENMMTIVVTTAITSFLCGFGLQVWYIGRVLHRDGLSLRAMLALNLDSLNGSWWSATWRATVTFLVAILLAQLTRLLPFIPTSDQRVAGLMAQLNGINLLAMALLTALAAPLLEEVVFRGFLFNMLRTQFRAVLTTPSRQQVSFRNFLFNILRGWLARILRGPNGADFAASIVSGAVFALTHLEPSAMIRLFIFGVLLSELYRRSGSLICPMLAHCINNTLGIALIVAGMTHQPMPLQPHKPVPAIQPAPTSLKATAAGLLVSPLTEWSNVPSSSLLLPVF